MAIKIRTGSLSDFFDSARETAREIDQGKKVTPKKNIWVEPDDLIRLLKPERTKLLRYLRGKHRVLFKDLVNEMRCTSSCMNRNLNLLSKYQLIRISKEKTLDHGIQKIIEPAFGNQLLEFITEI